MMVVITDGQENASRESSAHTVKQLIAEHEKSEKWQFVYMGADLSNFADADKLGIKYKASSQKSNLKEKFGKIAKHTSLFRSSDLNESWDNMFENFMDDLDDEKRDGK